MNIAHIHLAVNHLPVVGVLFSLVLYLIGEAKKNNELVKTSFQFFILTALTALIAYFSGGGAEEVVEHIPNISESLIENHEELAEFALVTTVLLGILSAGGLFWIRKNKEIPPFAKVVFLILALGATSLMAWAANLGGQIRHDEIRSSKTISS